MAYRTARVPFGQLNPRKSELLKTKKIGCSMFYNAKLFGFHENKDYTFSTVI